MPKTGALLLFLAVMSVGRPAVDPEALKSGIDLFNQRKWSDAQKTFETLDRTTPDNPDVLLYLGRLALQRDEYEKAVIILEKAATLAPNSSAIQQRLGDAYGSAARKASLFSQAGLAKKCCAAYEKAVQLDPKSVDARLSLVGFYQQAPGFVGGGMDKAHAQAEEIRKLDASRGRQAVAGIYVAEKKYPEAFAEYEAVLKEKPDDYAALFQTGRLAAISGQRPDTGLAALRHCLGQVPPENQPSHAAVHWRIGNILEKQGDKAGARAAYEAALKIDQKFSQAIESLKKL